MIGSNFTCLRYYIGAFPVGLKLSRSYLSGIFENLFKDQRTTFKVLGPCLVIVVSGCPLLISAIRMDAVSLILSAQSKFLHNSVFASSCIPASVRIVGSPISVGMTGSIPYARAKGVFPIGRPGVVR